MPVFYAKVVGKSRKRPWLRCESHWATDAAPYDAVIGASPHLVMFGCAERGDPPYTLRVCLPCARASFDKRVTDAVAAWDAKTDITESVDGPNYPQGGA